MALVQKEEVAHVEYSVKHSDLQIILSVGLYCTVS